MHVRRIVSVVLALAVVGCVDEGGGGDEASTASTSGVSSTGVGATAESSGSQPTSSSGSEGPGSTSDGTTTGAAETGMASATETGSETTGGDETTGETTGETGETTETGETGDPLADCPRLRVNVAPDPTLNVRPTPSTEMAPVASLKHGTIVETVAAVDGESIKGNTLWYQIEEPAGFVSGVFVECTQDLPPPPPAGYNLPLACGMSAKITQGNNGGTSHSGKAKYAFDFGLALNTPLHAMADGTVIHIYDETGPGDPCYNGGGKECFPYGNLVVLLHGDGSTSLYKHLNRVDVKMDQWVARGVSVGLSGSTGYSTGPHAHVMRMENCGANNCQSVPLEFIECGVPAKGQTVTSENCP